MSIRPGISVPAATGRHVFDTTRAAERGGCVVWWCGVAVPGGLRVTRPHILAPRCPANAMHCSPARQQCAAATASRGRSRWLGMARRMAVGMRQDGVWVSAGGVVQFEQSVLSVQFRHRGRPAAGPGRGGAGADRDPAGPCRPRPSEVPHLQGHAGAAEGPEGPGPGSRADRGDGRRRAGGTRGRGRHHVDRVRRHRTGRAGLPARGPGRGQRPAAHRRRAAVPATDRRGDLVAARGAPPDRHRAGVQPRPAAGRHPDPPAGRVGC